MEVVMETVDQFLERLQRAWAEGNHVFAECYHEKVQYLSPNGLIQGRRQLLSMLVQAYQDNNRGTLQITAKLGEVAKLECKAGHVVVTALALSWALPAHGERGMSLISLWGRANGALPAEGMGVGRFSIIQQATT